MNMAIERALYGEVVQETITLAGIPTGKALYHTFEKKIVGMFKKDTKKS
jgi:hypothetical protein